MAPAMHLPAGMDPHEMPDANMGNRRRLRWGLTVFLLIALFFLWQEHRAHLLGALPWLLLLACPLMHRFMHRGHRSYRRDDLRSGGEKQDAPNQQHEHGSLGCH